MDLASPRRWLSRRPRALIGAVVLITAVELVILRHELAIADPLHLDWPRAGREAVSSATTADILLFGDSQVKFGLLPPVLERETGRPSCSLALRSGPAPASTILLRRALASGARPSAVVVDFSWMILGDGPSSHARPYPWADLLTLAEGAELAYQARSPSLFAEIALARALPSLRLRHDLRARVAERVAGGVSITRFANLTLLRHWDRNQGAEVYPPNPSIASEILPGVPPRGRPCDPVNLHYLHEFFRLTARSEIACYYLIPPSHPSYASALDREGYAELQDQLAELIVGHYPNVTILDARQSGYGHDVFLDEVHLDHRGATTLSRDLGAFITHPERRRAHRFVRFPEFCKIPVSPNLETHPQSSIAVRRGLPRR